MENSFNPSEGLTISFWLKQTPGNVGYLFTKLMEDGETHYYACHLNAETQTLKFEYRPQGLLSELRVLTVSNISLVSGSLQNLAVEIFEDYFLLYLNGVLTYQVQMSNSMEDGTGTLYIGKHPGNNNEMFVGYMHSVSLYDVALSDYDVAVLVGTDTSVHLQPECRCPTGYIKLTETKCSTLNGNIVDRLNSLSRDSSMLNDGNLETYWQSSTGTSDVNITIDLEGTRRVIHVSMDFKSSIPYGIGIYYSSDGVVFSPRQFYARDCAIFGLKNNTALQSISDVNCISKSAFHYPFKNQFIEFLLVGSGNRPNADTIFQLNLQSELQQFAQASHVRIQLIGWHDQQSSDDQYFAITEVTIAGQGCICNGHASSCDDNMCVCQHNTINDNCDQCLPLYNDQEWQKGTVSLANPCVKCECNSHSENCTYNVTLDQGICQNCLHQTTGHNCEQCITYYYHPEDIALDSPESCHPCACNTSGITDDGDCLRGDLSDGTDSGNCSCKVNVGERDCSSCMDGFYGLRANNPEGCISCSCNKTGSLSEVCDKLTGQCDCSSGVDGKDCSKCAEGFHGFGVDGCQKCHVECVNCFGTSATECTVSIQTHQRKPCTLK